MPDQRPDPVTHCYEVLGQLQEWQRIRLAAGESDAIGAMFKSRLLARLLDGKPALPDPPPLHYAGPWYELVDDGHAQIREDEVWFLRDNRGTILGDTKGSNKVHICGGGGWTIEGETDEEIQLSYDRMPGRRWRLSGVERMLVGHRVSPRGGTEEVYGPGWKLELIPG